MPCLSCSRGRIARVSHRDPHLNVFHAYRDPGRDPESRAQQLEDNLTRALAITLSRLQDERVRSQLLVALGVQPEKAAGFRGSLLQVAVTDNAWPSDRRIVVVHGGPRLRRTEGGQSERGRLDAVLLGNHFVLGLESKLGDTVSHGQLAAHRRTLGADNHPPSAVTWSALARCAREGCRIATSEVDRFLLEQFEEYLRMNGFGGLIHEHFAYFAMSPEERHLKLGTKDGMNRAGKAGGSKA